MENTQKKRLLLLGGGHAEIPLIKAAQSLGYYVITTGNAREGLGHPYADKNVFADFSDKDAMLELARAEKVDAVCSGCNDFALLSTAYVCEKLGLPGHDSYETSLQIHHKDKYRALAEQLRIVTPRARTVRSLEEFKTVIGAGENTSCETAGFEQKNFCPLQFPLIVKPVDLTGGKGIHRANNVTEALAAYEDAISRTRQNHIVVEEFIEGTNHGFSAYLMNGKVVFYFADNEQYFLNKYMVSGANTPTTTSSAGIQKLITDSEKIAGKLNLVDGILHIQYIEKADGTPVIIEICRRPPGDLYIKFVKYATGVDYPLALIKAETGAASIELANTESGNQAPSKPFLRHCIMAETTGTVQEVAFAPDIEKNIVEKFLWYKPGEQIGDILYYKAGIVFMQFDSVEEMQEKTAQMTKYIRIVTE